MDPIHIYDLDESQAQAFNAIIKGRNVFITGSAGTGKSHLIKSVTDYYKTTHSAKRLVVTSLTGLSALIINGTTIHSFLGVGAYDPETPDEFYVKKTEKIYPVAKKIRDTNILIIDEISMMPCRMLTVMDKIFRTIRKRPNVLFGGIQVVALGDFFQLPPIYKQIPEDKLKYVFQHQNWTSYFRDQIELRHCHRQSDKEFIEILNMIRRGHIKHPVVEQFLSLRMEATRKISPDELSTVSRLFPTKDNVTSFNSNRLRELKTPSYIFDATVYRIKYIGSALVQPEPRPRQRSSGDSETTSISSLLDTTQYTMELETDETRIDRLFKNTITERKLELKVGALVMFTRNLDNSKGIVNGTMGIIKSITTADNCNYEGRMATIHVRTFNNQDYWVSAELMMCGYDYAINQVPLILAWAISIHKSQGSTYDRICIDVGQRLFECGQAYVALSRCRSPHSLYLTEICTGAFKCDPLVINYYNTTFGEYKPSPDIIQTITDSGGNETHETEESEVVVAKLWVWENKAYYITPDEDVYNADGDLLGHRVDGRLVLESGITD